MIIINGESIFRAIIYVVLGYVCGLWLSDYIYSDFSMTAWTNVWTYFWLFLWPFGLVYYFIILIGWAVVIIALIAVIAVLGGLLRARIAG